MVRIYILLICFAYLKGYSSNITIDNNQAVIDKAGVLTHSQISRLKSEVWSIKEKTSTKIKILLLSSLNEEVLSIITEQVAKKWKLNEDTSKSVLIIAAVDDNVFKIKGANVPLNDESSALLVDKKLSPAFSEGNYFEGLLETISNIEFILTKPTNGSLTEEKTYEDPRIKMLKEEKKIEKIIFSIFGSLFLLPIFRLIDNLFIKGSVGIGASIYFFTIIPPILGMIVSLVIFLILFGKTPGGGFYYGGFNGRKMFRRW